MPTFAQPVEPGADIGFQIATLTGRARLAPKLTEDAAHRLVPGQKHGVDERGQGLGVLAPFRSFGLRGR